MISSTPNSKRTAQRHTLYSTVFDPHVYTQFYISYTFICPCCVLAKLNLLQDHHQTYLYHLTTRKSGLWSCDLKASCWVLALHGKFAQVPEKPQSVVNFLAIHI